MKIKNFGIIVLFMILMLVSFSFAEQSVISSTKELKIILIKVDPSPIEIGGNAKLLFEVTNIDSVVLNNLDFSLSAAYPFTVKSSSINVNALSPGEKKNLEFELEVNNEAKEGDNYVSLQFYSPKKAMNIAEKFLVTISRSQNVVEGKINAQAIDLELNTISPGGTTELGVDVENNGKASMKDVKVKLDLTDLPFAPVFTTSERHINEILPGSSSKALFNLIVLPDAESKAYKIPITIEYYNDYGENTTKRDEIGLLVGAEPEYLTTLASTNIYQFGKKGKISISISNSGTSDMKFLVAELQESDCYNIISQPKIYVGNIDSDDYETVDYEIYTKRCKIDGEIPLKIELTYKDAYNRDKVEEKEVGLRIFNSIERSNYGLGETEGKIFTFIFYILLVILIYFTYKEWRKDKNIVKALKQGFLDLCATIVRFIRLFRWKNVKTWPKKIESFIKSVR